MAEPTGGEYRCQTSNGQVVGGWLQGGHGSKGDYFLCEVAHLGFVTILDHLSHAISPSFRGADDHAIMLDPESCVRKPRTLGDLLGDAVFPRCELYRLLWFVVNMIRHGGSREIRVLIGCGHLGLCIERLGIVAAISSDPC
jgi:hypothetical protein